jgi:hypothetical protein
MSLGFYFSSLFRIKTGIRIPKLYEYEYGEGKIRFCPIVIFLFGVEEK